MNEHHAHESVERATAGDGDSSPVAGTAVAGTAAAGTAREYWDSRYGERARMWSGHANTALVEIAASLTPGTALDLGCGEGADAIWLAEHGWTVTGIDVSATALERARGEALERGLPAAGITWQERDLAHWSPEAGYDLVAACFLHSPISFPREQALRRAADAVAVGGCLLIVGHAAPPPWSRVSHDEHHRFLSAREELDALDPDPSLWTVLVGEDRPREATGPNGEQAELTDAVLLLRRER